MMKKTKGRKSRWTVPLISELYCNDMQNLIPLNTDVSTDLLRVRELVVEYDLYSITRLYRRLDLPSPPSQPFPPPTPPSSPYPHNGGTLSSA